MSKLSPARDVGILKEFLDPYDAYRAAEVMSSLGDCTLTGSIALEIQMASHGHIPQQIRLNDLDYVIDRFESIPTELASQFLVHHIHPRAPSGKLLLQLVDPVRSLRVDLFRAFGASLSRANTFHRASSKPMHVLSIEDLAARYTAQVYGHLRKGCATERKHAKSFQRLAAIGDFNTIGLETAWHDHRENLKESFAEARDQTIDLLQRRADLLFEQTYSVEVRPCDQCHDCGPFQRAEPALIIKSLGYW